MVFSLVNTALVLVLFWPSGDGYLCCVAQKAASAAHYRYLLLITVSFESTNNDVISEDFVCTLYIYFKSNVLLTYNPDRYR